MQSNYPIVELTTQGMEIVPHRGVDLDSLSAQLAPVRDALLELFKGASTKGRGGLQRIEVGLSVTRDGRIAFITGNATPSLTLTFERRPPAPSRSTAARVVAAAEPDMVTID